MAPIHVAEVLLGIRDLADPTIRADRQEHIPELSVGSAMEGVRESTHPEDSPALAAASMVEAEAEASTAAVAATAVAEAIDSPYEVIKT